MKFNAKHIDFLEISKFVNVFLTEEYICNSNDGDDYQNYYGEQSHYRKMLSNEWSSVVKWSINSGNNHFAITINVPEFYKSYNTDSIIIYEFYSYIEDVIIDLFPTLTWIFIVAEENKKGTLHFHIAVAIRNFIDYNYIIKNNISEVLIDKLGYYLGYDHKVVVDIRTDSLLYFKDIKNWVIYMHKDLVKWKYHGLLVFVEYDDKDPNSFNYGVLDDIYSYYIRPNESVNVSWIEEEKYKKIESYKELFWKLNGIKLNYNKVDQRTLVNILQYYLILNNYYIYNDNIYEKIKESKISYKIVGSLIEILYNKFQERVVSFYISKFPGYFDGFDFSYLLDTYFLKTKNIIESIKDISTQRINPSFELIEFRDGIYSIKYDRFFPNKESLIFNKKISTIKYYNKSYNRVRQDKPMNWINGIKNALGIKNSELINQDYVQICLHIINPIHNNIFDKKASLFVYGPSNTGKTSLIANILNDYFGSNNVGSIISSRNFKWQDLVGKTIGIIDEGRYNSSMSSDLLKITGQEKIIVEKKYSKEHIVINPIPLIILSNILFEDKDKSVDDALRSRLYIIEFINTISKSNLNNSKKFKVKLKNEEVNIIIYCNKILFKLKEDNSTKIGDRISNIKLLEIISREVLE